MSFANPITISDFGNPTMTISSLDIATLVESRHDSVKRTIERCVEKGAIDQPPLVDGPKSANQVTIQVYNLEKRDSFVVVAQLSPQFTARLVDRWQELENAHKLSPTELLVAQAQRLLAFEREQQALAKKTDEALSRLDQIETAGEHFTIIGWSRLSGRQVTLPMASSMGGKATRYCKDRGIPTGSVPDARFGRANTYPKNVLDYLFSGDDEVES